MNKRKQQILELAGSANGVRPHELIETLLISNVAVHRYLKELLEQGLLCKRGKSPNVRYLKAELSTPVSNLQLPEIYREGVEQNFCYFTPDGTQLAGVHGFLAFLQKTQQAQSPAERAAEYLKIIETANSFRSKSGLIDSTQKIADTFEEIFIKKLYYSDFYSLPKYGKTRLGQYLLHGKSGQNKNLIHKIALETRQHILEIISKHSIEAVAFAPHSIPRKIPFLIEYKKYLHLNLPEIKLIKAFSGDLPIAQKSLSKLSERIENAKQTIFIADNTFSFDRILILDDALGSGATINEIGRKLSGPTRQIFAYAIVGSYKGFEVIKEA